jgi:hypothetical protein
MKERYIRRYGNSYELPSPNAGELMRLFVRTCREHGILCKWEECFQYLREFPEKYEQMDFFDLLK